MTENIIAMTMILADAVAVWALLWLILRTLARVLWSTASVEIFSMLPFSMIAGVTAALLLFASNWSLATLYTNIDHASLPGLDTMRRLTIS